MHGKKAHSIEIHYILHPLLWCILPIPASLIHYTADRIHMLNPRLPLFPQPQWQSLTMMDLCQPRVTEYSSFTDLDRYSIAPPHAVARIRVYRSVYNVLRILRLSTSTSSLATTSPFVWNLSTTSHVRAISRVRRLLASVPSQGFDDSCPWGMSSVLRRTSSVPLTTMFFLHSLSAYW